jgi:hypothetical protein
MNRKIAVLMTVLVALAGAAGAASAATWDAENASTSNLTLELTPAEAGVDYLAYTNSSPDTVDGTNGHYSFEVSYDELDTLPRDSNGAQYNATIVDDSGNVVVETEVTFNTAANASEDAYMAVTGDANSDGAALTNLVADTTEFETTDSGFFDGLASMVSFGSESTNDSAPDVATFSGFTTVNGSNSDVIVQLTNESTQDAYANEAAAYEDGEWIKGMTATLNGVPYRVYKDSAPSDANGTVVVYDSSADQLEISLGEEFERTSTVSIRSSGGSGYGFGALWSNFGVQAALSSLI